MKNITQAPPQEFEAYLQECASYNLRRITRLTTNSLNHALQDTGLRSTQLAIMVGAGAVPGGTMTIIAERLGLDISTLARSLDSLIDIGYIEIKSGKKREKLVYLTHLGKEKVDAAIKVWRNEHQKFLKQFGETDWQRCNSAFRHYSDQQQTD